MKKTLCLPLLAFGGLSQLLGCGTDPVGTPSSVGGGSGAGGSVGTAGQTTGGSVANTAGASTGGGGAGQAGSAGASTTAGAGGSVAGGGGGGGGGGGTTGGGGGAGGGGGGKGGAAGAGGGGPDADGFIDIFNGTDLTGWIPLIHKSKVNEDPDKTFRADPVNHVIKVTYENYPGGSFDDRCGNLYYNKLLKNYRVKVTYRFVEPQAKNPVSWGKNNSGLMIFGIDPAKVTNDPEFPPLIEIQLLGANSGGGNTTPNICTPGGMTLAKQTGGCGDNKTGVAPPPAGNWTTVEAEVHVTGDTKVFQYPEMTKPILTLSGPMYKGAAVMDGYLSLQSESQPCEFKDIKLKELP